MRKIKNQAREITNNIRLMIWNNVRPKKIGGLSKRQNSMKNLFAE